MSRPALEALHLANGQTNTVNLDKRKFKKVHWDHAIVPFVPDAALSLSSENIHVSLPPLF